MLTWLLLGACHLSASPDCPLMLAADEAVLGPRSSSSPLGTPSAPHVSLSRAILLYTIKIKKKKKYKSK